MRDRRCLLSLSLWSSKTNRGSCMYYGVTYVLHGVTTCYYRTAACAKCLGNASSYGSALSGSMRSDKEGRICGTEASNMQHAHAQHCTSIPCPWNIMNVGRDLNICRIYVAAERCPHFCPGFGQDYLESWTKRGGGVRRGSLTRCFPWESIVSQIKICSWPITASVFRLWLEIGHVQFLPNSLAPKLTKTSQNYKTLQDTVSWHTPKFTHFHTFPLYSHLHLASWCWNFPATFCNSLFASWSWCAQHSCVSNLCVCVFLLLVLLFRLLFEDPTFLQGVTWSRPDPDRCMEALLGMLPRLCWSPWASE